MATAKDILNQITMINNIKYNNNNNNTSIVSKENNEEEDIASLSSGIATLSFEEALASSGTLPANWRGVKLDLFANPGHTLKITIIRHDGTRFACSANLNSPRSYVFRGRETQGSKSHWHLVEYLMELRDDYEYKISKVGKPKKSGTLLDFAAMIYFTQQVWNVDLVYEHKIWNFKLDKETSPAFTNKNGIATGYHGITGYTKPWQDPKELGI
jgi:hypothetical protein